MFVDLTATYDPVWHCGLNCKLLRFLPDRYTVRMFMGMVGNCGFILSPETAKGIDYDASRTVSHRDGSVLVPLLFNVYISDLPAIVSRKYAYADDLAIMHGDGETGRQ